MCSYVASSARSPSLCVCVWYSSPSPTTMRFLPCGLDPTIGPAPTIYLLYFDSNHLLAFCSPPSFSYEYNSEMNLSLHLSRFYFNPLSSFLRLSKFPIQFLLILMSLTLFYPYQWGAPHFDCFWTQGYLHVWYILWNPTLGHLKLPSFFIYCNFLSFIYISLCRCVWDRL